MVLAARVSLNHGVLIGCVSGLQLPLEQSSSRAKSRHVVLFNQSVLPRALRRALTCRAGRHAVPGCCRCAAGCCLRPGPPDLRGSAAVLGPALRCGCNLSERRQTLICRTQIDTEEGVRVQADYFYDAFLQRKARFEQVDNSTFVTQINHIRNLFDVIAQLDSFLFIHRVPQVT